MQKTPLLLLLLCGFFSIAIDATSQVRDLRAERIVLDDDGADGTANTMTIQTPGSLPQNVVVIIPDMGSDSAEFLLLPYGSAGPWLLNGNTGTTPGTNYLGTSDATALHLYVNGGNDNSLILNTNGSLQRDVGGNARGTNAVDLQSDRIAATQVASGDYAVIAGGLSNLAAGTGSVVGGGDSNRILGGSTGAVIGGGYSNYIRANATYSTIGGGQENNVWDNHLWATIGGGYQNSVQDDYTTVGGGLSNVMESGTYASVIAGGDNNRVYSNAGYSAIGGGARNYIRSRTYSTISGGESNEIQSDHGTIGGGYQNDINGSARYGTIGGGQNNQVQSNYGAIGGGQDNTISNSYATITGGRGNMIAADYGTINGGSYDTIEVNAGSAMIGGGIFNKIGSGSWQATINGGSNTIGSNSWRATIAGGNSNVIGASSNTSVIGGGLRNTIQIDNATISGGTDNTIETGATHSVIGGGTLNTIDTNASFATIGGGRNNFIGRSSTGSVIAGGRGLTIDGSGTFGFLGNNSTGSRNMSISAGNTSVLGNTDLWLANNDGSASRLRFYEANSTTGDFPTATTFYTSFEAGNQTADINYILPTAAPTSNGQILSSSTSGVMSWTDGPTGAQSFANGSNTTPTLTLENNAGGDDGVAFRIVEGSMQLSNGQGAPAAIPDDVVVYDIDDATASSAPTVGLPASGSAGKILYVYISDPDGATVGGVGQASGATLTYVYVGGAWRLF